MKVRSFILLRIVPIFVALASANAAALYWAESSEIELNLTQEAEAATVTLGEYLAARPELASNLASPPRRSALAVAMAQMPGLKGIALLDSRGRCCLLEAGRPLKRTTAVTPLGASGILQHPTGEHFIRSTKKLPGGKILVLEIDAERALSARSALLSRIWLIVAAGAVSGVVVSLIIAAWLTGDLCTLRRLTAGDAQESPQTRFVETQDVADSLIMLRDNLATSAALKKRRLIDRHQPSGAAALAGVWRAASTERST